MEQLRFFRGRLALAVLAACLFCCLATSAGATTYSFQTLDNQTDPTFNQLLGINNSGTIAGYYGVGTATNPNKGYTLARPYGQANYTNENFPSSAQTQVVGINNNASPTTVGFWVDNAGNDFGFVKQGSNFTSVSNPNTPPGGPLFNQLMGVNDQNIAVGVYTDVNNALQAYSYNIAANKFTAITLPASFGAIETTATGVNNAGDISGFYVDGADVTHGFLDIGGTFSRFDDPNGAFVNTSFLGLNNNGEVVGSYIDASGLTDGLTYNYLTNTWTTVNDPFASATPAFLINGTTINGVNDLGQLVGFYSDGTNVDGFLATPVPEPAAVGLIGAGLIACIWMRKRRGSVMTKMHAALVLPIALTALGCVPLRADAIQFGFNGDAQLQNGNVVLFGQYPNGAPYAPPPGFGTFEVSEVNAGVFSNNGLTTGEFGLIQSLFLQPGPLTTFEPFMTFDMNASNLTLWATSMPAGNDGALTAFDTPVGAIVSFGVEGYIKDSTNPSYTQNVFGAFSLTFAGDTVAQVMQSTVNTPFTATVSLTAPPLPASTPAAPEPGSILLLGSGLLAVGISRFRAVHNPEVDFMGKD